MERLESALSLITAMSTAATPVAAVDVFQQAIEPFGVRLFKTVVMGNVIRAGGEQIIASNWPAEWDAFYQGKRAFTFDPVAAAGMRSDGFFWRNLPQSKDADGRKLMADARQLGMVDGFTAVRRSFGASATAINLAGLDLEWTPAEQSVVTLLAHTFISRMLYLREIDIAPVVEPLSRRETEILSHAAAGRHDKEIAIALELSHETIHFYWKSIRRKLGATDRASAVAIALWSGQIVA